MLKSSSLMIVTAVGLSACGTQPAARATKGPAQSVARDIKLVADTTVVSAKVAAGATRASILETHDVVASDVAALVQGAASVFDLRKVRAHQPYVLVKTLEGLLRRLEYEIDGDRLLRVVRTDPGADAALVADVLPIPKTRRVEIVHGRIDREHSSLVAALDAAGETIDLTLALADGRESSSDGSAPPGSRPARTSITVW